MAARRPARGSRRLDNPAGTRRCAPRMRTSPSGTHSAGSGEAGTPLTSSLSEQIPTTATESQRFETIAKSVGEGPGSHIDQRWHDNPKAA